LLTFVTITALAGMMALPGLSYVHAVKAAERQPPPGLLGGGFGLRVSHGSIDLGIGGLSIHADKCRGVSIGSGAQIFSPSAIARCAVPLPAR
jgi:hypothetical protein